MKGGCCCLVGTLILDAWAAAHAEGFRNPPAGAFGLGRAGGRIAQVADATAATHNPANLVDLESAELAADPTFVFIRTEYASAAGSVRTQTRDPWKMLPNAHAAVPLGQGRFALGLGITAPYGLSNEWEPQGPFRYQAPEFTELKSVNFSPSFAACLCSALNLGVGLDAMASELTLRQAYPWALVTGQPAAADGVAKAKGDGIGYGAHAGLTWTIAPGHRLAATCRSPVAVDYQGHFGITQTPAPLASLARSSFASRIEFPTTVALGYAIHVHDRVNLEIDGEWLQFSRFDQLPLRVGAPAPGIPAAIRQDWKDTFTAGIAGDWRVSAGWTLRAGYQFYQSPVPDRTLSPTIPDADQNVVTVGLAYRGKRHAIEAAYGRVFYADRQIQFNQNPAFDGRYSTEVHLISLTYRLRL